MARSGPQLAWMGAEGRVGIGRFSQSSWGTWKVLTFSISCRSSRLRPSREQVLCAGITAVQMHFPSGAWAEVYSCQPSSGLWKRVCREVRGQRAGTQWGIHPAHAGGERGPREMTDALECAGPSAECLMHGISIPLQGNPFCR